MKQLIDKYLGGHDHVEQGNQYYYYCPNCHWKNPRFSLNFDKDVYHCWYCGFAGSSMLYLLYYLNASAEDIREAKIFLNKEELLNREDHNASELHYEILSMMKGKSERRIQQIFPEKHWKVLHKHRKDDFFFRRAYVYLRKKRGMSDYEIYLYNIQFDEKELALVLPSYDLKGRLNFYTHHYFEGGYYKNAEGNKKTDIIFNEYHLDFRQPVIVTEGYYDAVNIGHNAVPILGTYIQSPLIYKFVAYDTPMVYLFLDGDAQRSSVAISKYLSDFGVPNKIVDTPEGEDGNSLKRERIAELLEDSQKYNFESLIKKKLENISI